MNNKSSFSSLMRSLLLHNSNAYKACAGKGYWHSAAGKLNLSLILMIAKNPSNELVSFSLLFFSQRLGTMNVTILASAVFPGDHFMVLDLKLNVTVPTSVTL